MFNVGPPPKQTTYKFLEPLCYVQQAFVPNKNKEILTDPCPFFERYFNSPNAECETILNGATYAKSRILRRTLQKSFDKCDVPVSKVEDELQEYVYSLVKNYMFPILHRPICSYVDSVDFKADASPGKMWNLKGCHTKAQALKHPDFQKAFYNTSEISPIDCNGKTEFLERQLIEEEDKLRTVFNVPVDNLFKQKVLFDNQNESIIKQCDSMFIKYGFTKQYGGFSRFCQKVEEFGKLKTEGDASGYDRNINLEDVYRLREECLIYDRTNHDLVDFVRTTILFILHQFIFGPDGYLYRKITGNISGSNNTASDNSLAHLFILFRLVCKLWLKQFGVLPTLKDVLEAVLSAIYSDDFLTVYKDWLIGDMKIEDFELIQKNTYAEFGLVLKPSQTLTTMEDGRVNCRHSFLGSNFGYSDFYNCYMPIPRIGKLCTSVVYTLSKHSVDHVFTKMVTLCLLTSVMPEYFIPFHKYLLWLIENHTITPELLEGYENLLFKTSPDAISWQGYLLGRE